VRSGLGLVNIIDVFAVLIAILDTGGARGTLVTTDLPALAEGAYRCVPVSSAGLGHGRNGWS